MAVKGLICIFVFPFQSYEKAFAQIKKTTEIDDLHLLVGKFIETEDKNFALFNYVNELNNEIEVLQEQIARMEKNIDDFKQEAVNMDDQQQNIMKEMKVSSHSGGVDFLQCNFCAAYDKMTLPR